jgi:hypothetical protein
MALTKRGKTWHTHFFVDGQRFRQSLETSDWREAQAKEKTLIAAAKQGKLTPLSEDFARLIFEDAAVKYLLGRSPTGRVQPKEGTAVAGEAEGILPW